MGKTEDLELLSYMERVKEKYLEHYPDLSDELAESIAYRVIEVNGWNDSDRMKETIKLIEKHAEEYRARIEEMTGCFAMFAFVEFVVELTVNYLIDTYLNYQLRKKLNEEDRWNEIPDIYCGTETRQTLCREFGIMYL